MADPIQHFLLVFDHNRSELVHLEEFGPDGDGALKAYAAKEKEFGEPRVDSAIEIVLIGSDSLETVKLTHANYFEGSVPLSQYLAGIS